MYDQNGKEQELEKVHSLHENPDTDREDFTLNNFTNKSTSKQPVTLSNPRLTGDLPRDIVNLMSLKPEHYQISFTGLKRILGNVHQQQLVNTIDRLVDDSILFKSQDGYELASNMVKNKPLNDTWSETFIGSKLYPSPISVQKVFKSLYGKWFGKNRFLGGVVDSKHDEAFLEWINMTDRRSQTKLEVRSHELVAKFNNVDPFERDKALNVFSDTLNSFSNPVMFEKESNAFMNN